MLTHAGYDEPGMVSEINVTPLVDVMLVLLIVFMVTAPLLIPQSLGVKLPQTASVQSPVDHHLTRLQIRADGLVQLEDQVLSDQMLRAALAAKANDPKFQLQVEADEALRYGRLAEIMALAQGGGVSRLSFVTVARNK